MNEIDQVVVFHFHKVFVVIARAYNRLVVDGLEFDLFINKIMLKRGLKGINENTWILRIFD